MMGRRLCFLVHKLCMDFFLFLSTFPYFCMAFFLLYLTLAINLHGCLWFSSAKSWMPFYCNAIFFSFAWDRFLSGLSFNFSFFSLHGWKAQTSEHAILYIVMELTAWCSYVLLFKRKWIISLLFLFLQDNDAIILF